MDCVYIDWIRIRRRNRHDTSRCKICRIKYNMVLVFSVFISYNIRTRDINTNRSVLDKLFFFFLVFYPSGFQQVNFNLSGSIHLHNIFYRYNSNNIYVLLLGI